MQSKVDCYWIPPGHLGVEATLEIMAKIVNEYSHHPLTRMFAIKAVQGTGGKNRFFQAQAIRKWVLDSMSFIRDPAGKEMVHTPENMLMQYEEVGVIYGDCDDMAVLSASLGKAIGIDAGFVVLGFVDRNIPYSHVYTVLKTEKGWMPIDIDAGYPAAKSLVVKKAWKKI